MAISNASGQRRWTEDRLSARKRVAIQFDFVIFEMVMNDGIEAPCPSFGSRVRKAIGEIAVGAQIIKSDSLRLADIDKLYDVVKTQGRINNVIRRLKRQ